MPKTLFPFAVLFTIPGLPARLAAICLALGIFSGTAAAGSPRDAGERRVVVLYSTPLDFPATEMTEKGLRETLLADPRFQVQLFSEYLDLSRFRDAGQRQALADLLERRYGGQNLDAVIGIDVPATLFLMDFEDVAFPGVPIILSSIPESMRPMIQASGLGARAVSVFEPQVAARLLVESALRLKPETRRVVLVSGDFEGDRIRSQALREALAALPATIEFVDLTGLALRDILDQCAGLSQDTLLFFSTLFVDGEGRGFIPRNVLQTLMTVAPVPVFGPYASYMGAGIVGGPLVSLHQQGRRAGDEVLAVFRGASRPGTAAGQDATGFSWQYDWRQLRRHDIDVRQLHPEARIFYEEITAWDMYKHYMLGLGLVLALQSALIFGLLANLRRRRRAEAALLEHQRELRNLAGRLLSSQEEELRRLSREFHDDLAQRLAAVTIEAGTLEIQAAQVGPGVVGKVRSIKDKLSCLSEDVHAISRELHPAILRDLGLRRAVNSLCVGFGDREGISVACHVEDIPENVSEEAALCVYRVIQESLRNIAKHARARSVDIHVGRDRDRIVASIEDDGIGFDPRCARYTPGIGLASMRERVQYVNGEFTIHSEPGQGAVISMAVPWEGGRP